MSIPPAAQSLPIVVGSMIKDEESYIAEWIAHWLGLGVSHFFIYNNNSTDGTVQRLAPLCAAGLVTIIEWPVERGQIAAFNHCLSLSRSISDWLGFFDTDEYLVLHKHSTIFDYLESLNADQVLIPWKNFGYCGKRERPLGLTIASYLYPFVEARVSVKHFFRPHSVQRSGVHSSTPTATCRIVFENGAEAKHQNFQEYPQYKMAQINHYKRSLNEFTQRVSKGEADAISLKKIPPFLERSELVPPRYKYEPSDGNLEQRTLEILAKLHDLTLNTHAYGSAQPVPFFYAYSDCHIYLLVSIGLFLMNEDLSCRMTACCFYNASMLKPEAGNPSDITTLPPFNLHSLGINNSCQVYAYSPIDLSTYIASPYFIAWAGKHHACEVLDLSTSFQNQTAPDQFGNKVTAVLYLSFVSHDGMSNVSTLYQSSLYSSPFSFQSEADARRARFKYNYLILLS